MGAGGSQKMRRLWGRRYCKRRRLPTFPGRPDHRSSPAGGSAARSVGQVTGSHMFIGVAIAGAGVEVCAYCLMRKRRGLPNFPEAA